MKVYQIHFNEESKNRVHPPYIPYDNSQTCTLYFENDVILDVWRNKRSEWENEDYVGVLSWRFFEKTWLTYDDLIKGADGVTDVYLLTPPQYIGFFKSPLSNIGYRNIQEIAKIADKDNLFPFKLYKYDNENCISFCNYFLVKPYVFHDYCKNYLAKFIDYLEYSRNPELKHQLSLLCPHNNKSHPAHPFILEGLFQCFVHHNRIPYKYIFNSLLEKEYRPYTVLNSFIAGESPEERVIREQEYADKEYERQKKACIDYYIRNEEQ
jgi:hypothetical protein